MLIRIAQTDPPYGVGLKVKSNDFRGSRNFDKGASMRASRLYRDDAIYVRRLIDRAIPLALGLSERAAITPGPAMMFHYPEPNNVGSLFTPNGAGRSSWGFQCSHPIFYYGQCPYLSSGQGSLPNGFRTEQPNKEIIDHPCPKPLEWMIWLVRRVSLLHHTILDPFMGSGTTGVACANLGRRFIGVEIEPKYFEIAKQRIEQAYAQGDLFHDAPEPPEQTEMAP